MVSFFFGGGDDCFSKRYIFETVEYKLECMHIDIE